KTAPDATKPRLRIAIALGAAALIATGAIAFALTGGDDARPASTSPEATLTFCKRHFPAPLFCADFEGSGDIRAGFWNAGKSPDSGQLGGGTISALEASADSSRALKASTPALAAAENKASAFVIAELPDLRYATIYVRMRINSEGFTDDTSVAQLLALSWGQPGAIGIS